MSTNYTHTVWTYDSEHLSDKEYLNKKVFTLLITDRIRSNTINQFVQIFTTASELTRAIFFEILEFIWTFFIMRS